MSQQLVDAADIAIELALKDNGIVEGTNEPSEVARLVNALPNNLVQAWSDFVGSGAMTITAAFCHAKPRVAWASPLMGHNKRHEPELGDLLLVMDVQSKNGRSRRALLIQVKKSKANGMQCTLTREDDLVQRYMYSDWPVFDVLGAQGNASKVPLKNVNISGLPSQMNLQARYAVVRSRDSKSPGWFLELATAPFSPPQPPTHKKFKSLGNVTLGTQQSLGKGLAELYSGAIGRNCDVNDDWSNLISYLETYVWEHTASHHLPHVQAALGAVPSALTSATSYLAAPAHQFVAYSGNRHVPASQWMSSNLFRPAKNKGVLYKWPGLNYPLQSSEIPVEPENGFGVIRIVIDQPLKLDDESV